MGGFITFEGCEGSGKSTQLKLLKEYLDKNKIDYLIAREPGGNVVSEKIRNIILDKDLSSMTDECEALLYAASRVQLIKEVVLPALQKGKLVILDRYIDSSFAYQAYARNLGFEFIEKINSVAIENCSPNLTIFLDIEPEKAFERKGGFDKSDRIEAAGILFHKRVYEGYIETSKRYPQRFFRLDVSGTKEETHQEIIKLLKNGGYID